MGRWISRQCFTSVSVSSLWQRPGGGCDRWHFRSLQEDVDRLTPGMLTARHDLYMRVHFQPRDWSACLMVAGVQRWVRSGGCKPGGTGRTGEKLSLSSGEAQHAQWIYTLRINFDIYMMTVSVSCSLLLGSDDLKHERIHPETHLLFRLGGR